MVAKLSVPSHIAEGDGDPRHGTTGGYTNHKCRCSQCRAAWNEYHAAYKRAQRRRLGGLSRPDHLARLEATRLPCGTHAAYVHHRRKREAACALCKAAEAEYVRARRAAPPPA